MFTDHAQLQSLETWINLSAYALGKQVDFHVEGLKNDRLMEGAPPVINQILPALIGNAVFYGIEKPAERLKAGKSASATIRINISQYSTGITITVSDDGRGLQLNRLQALVNSQPTTISGAHGQSAGYTPLNKDDGTAKGEDFLSHQLHAVGGVISVAARKGKFCCFKIQLPFSNTINTAIGDVALQGFLQHQTLQEAP